LPPPAARRQATETKVTKATLPKILADRELQRQESVRKIARDILGLDSVEQTGKINAKAVRLRHVIQKTLLGEATMSPERIALLRLMMAYGYGTPDKMQPEESKQRSLVFISEGGLPWENDPLKEQEAKAIAAQQAQDQIEAAAAERKRQGLEPDPDDDEDPNAPQLVR
jgi:hypothetical protein